MSEKTLENIVVLSMLILVIATLVFCFMRGAADQACINAGVSLNDCK